MQSEIKKVKKNKMTVFDALNYIIMAFIVVVTLYPFLYVLFASLSDPMRFMESGGAPLLRPLGFNLESYRAVFSNKMIVRGMRNSFVILALYLVISMTLTSIGAYFLSRKNVLFKKTVFIMIVITMYFSGGLIPTFLAVKSYGLYDTLWSVILTGAISTYNLIVLKTGFEAIPDSLEESARIDGADHFWILTNIVLPLSKANLAVVALYYAVSCWNSWFSAMIYINDRELFPAQLVLRQILIENSTNDMTISADVAEKSIMGETVKYAVIIFTTLPILIAYPFLQKFFVKGVMIGAVKG